MSSAYHPQPDGKTEVLNRYLEDYLRCFTDEHHRQWSRFLPWAEWHYNSSWHSSIQLAPYQAVFGRPPPTLLQYMSNTTTTEAVNTILSDRQQVLTTLKSNLQ